MQDKTKQWVRWAVLAVIVGALFLAGVFVMRVEASEAPPRADVVVLSAEGDSVLMRVQWTAAPRATFYRAELGDDAGTWTRNAATTTLSAVLWALLTEVEQPAFACVVAWNTHPTRGEQEGGRRCTDFTVPADLLPPGQPGSIEIFPDTTELRIIALSPAGLSFSLPSLGENAMDLSYAYRASGVQYTCVRFPDGAEGLVESQTVNGWQQHTVPNPRIWLLDGCHPEASSNAPDLATVHWQPSQPVLSLWPGATPVVLIEDRIVFWAHRNSADIGQRAQ